jgi:hypothetical protein
MPESTVGVNIYGHSLDASIIQKLRLQGIYIPCNMHVIQDTCISVVGHLSHLAPASRTTLLLQFQQAPVSSDITFE